MWTQLGQDLYGDNPDDHFGFSVSISADGNRIAIGSDTLMNVFSSDDPHITGPTRVYQRYGNYWIQESPDLNINGQDDSFGYALELSADGHRLVVGAPGGNEVQVYEFARTQKPFFFS